LIEEGITEINRDSLLDALNAFEFFELALIKLESSFLCSLHHPHQRDMAEWPGFIRIQMPTTTNVSMVSRKPDLLNVLWGII
jgi:hypothetical protein